jgi:glycerol-3-phosphate dehydrogenase (NAD(P)+)
MIGLKIGILGGGAMSNAIFHILSRNGISCEVFSRKNGNISQIKKCELMFICIPSVSVVEYTDLLCEVPIVVSCSKGLSGNDDFFISKLFNSSQFCVLAGPNFANEILANARTITTVASKNLANIKAIASMLRNDVFEVEESSEVLGVEICGIVKNAMAIIMGYNSVKTNFWNEKSIVLTKCFGELSQILEYFGCDKSILQLSCGIGDIFLTCSTTNSRNFKFGANFANGIEDCTQTVEGLRSFEFIRKLPIEIPILKGYAKTIVQL